jgi:iron(III) transport system substrate-binding protein
MQKAKRTAGRAPFALATVLAAALAAGSPSPALAQDAPRSGPEVFAYLHGLPAAERLAVLEREAGREGQLVIYGALGIDTFEKWQGYFNERYPEITVEFVRLTGMEVPERSLLEHRAGRVNADGIISDQSLMALLEEVQAPYESTQWERYDPRFRSGSFDEGWTAMVVYMTPTTIAWRTDRVSDAEAPRSIEQLVAEADKWRGRVGATNQLERFMAALIEGYGEDKAMTLVEGLASLQPRLYPSTAALFQAAGAGEFDVAFNFNHDRPAQLKRAGAPIEYVMQDPLHGSGVTFAVLKGAARPYAAALFMEVMTDPEVQELFDQDEDGLRLYGHLDGDYINDLADFPSLIPFGAVSEEDFRRLSELNERLFIRR